MYISAEGMRNAGIVLETQTINYQDLQEQQMRNMNAQFGGSTRGG